MNDKNVENVGTLEDFFVYELTAEVRRQSVYESLLDDPPFCEIQILWNLDLVVADDATILIPVPREQEWIVVDVVVVAANDDDAIHCIAFCTKTTRRS